MNEQAELELDDMAQKLIKSQSKDQIDQRAEECIKKFKGIYYRQSRRSLARILFNVQSHMQQLLPFYARFASIMNTYYPEFGAEMVNLLM